MTETYLQALKILSEGKAEKATRQIPGSHRIATIKHFIGGYYKFIDSEDMECRMTEADINAQWTIEYKEEHKPYEALMIFKGERVYLEKMMSLSDTLNMWEGPDLHAIFSIDIRDQVYTKIYEQEEK